MIEFHPEGFQQVSKQLEAIALGVDDKRKVVKQVLRHGAKIVNKTMKDKTPVIKGGETFNVYRTNKINKGQRAPKGMGKIYVKIKPGTLRKSVGIFQTKASRKFPGINIGPRFKSGVWKSPEKGGWFQYFVQTGSRGKFNVPPVTFVADSFRATSAKVKTVLETKMKSFVHRLVKANGSQLSFEFK